MLNYIWAGLIVFSFVFAMVNDLRDIGNDTFRNGKPLPAVIEPAGGTKVNVRIDQAAYNAHYGVSETVSAPFPATLVDSERGQEVRFDEKASLPPLLARIRDATAGEDSGLFKETKPKPLLALVIA